MRQTKGDAVFSFELKNVLIGGERVGFDRRARSLQLAGESVPIDEWLEIRRRIDLIIGHEMRSEEWKELREKLAWLGKRDRLPRELRDWEPDGQKPSTNFLSRNFDVLNDMKDGTVKRAPWWIRWLYSAVVTKGS